MFALEAERHMDAKIRNPDENPYLPIAEWTCLCTIARLWSEIA